ncbi:LysR family transcriptional regulator, chromosome initiation inhibitor [Oceanospirillum multiglobuliferum]|uniref:Transcriptional regulator ArgP n=1 Tax=Oceanospirillum multiglobuliferum TaxID=64969 RepID=A0A1T4PRT5_9GAMM|nr:LysR family transcriptional regulator ArgP [Oceanospirillum multiglobuliferum]OPX55413.1 transcriptional regulator ArgP [Oceanospirillum multiglobuliferum]SJZ94300.1 LysR family transcriptional regulator, chromosome initiation inhibitor [Oceanospirillum multiglobuliferum]
MLELKQLAALAAVIEEQSFDKAARRLFITQSAVSQRLKQLEDRLGQTLVIRTSPIQATEAGRQAMKHYRQVMMLQNELLHDLSPQEDKGFAHISIGINADSLQTWFIDAVSPLLLEHQLLLDLKVDDQEQTHHLLRTGEVMGCITSSPEPMQGCSCIPLGVMPYRCLASPDYIQRFFPDGVSAEAFRYAPVAEFNNKDELQNRYLKTFFGIEASEYPRHRIPSSDPYFQMVIRGFACGMIPDQQSKAQLKQGIVQDLTPGRYMAVPLYWHVWNLKSATIKLLTEQLINTCQQQLDSIANHPELIHPQPIRR